MVPIKFPTQDKTNNSSFAIDNLVPTHEDLNRFNQHPANYLQRSGALTVMGGIMFAMGHYCQNTNVWLATGVFWMGVSAYCAYGISQLRTEKEV